MMSQADKARLFRDMHYRDRAFIIPNPWDAGTANILASLGFEALATTSAGFAFSRGCPDNRVGREAMMAHVRELAAATDLPLSADLENGFGSAPETVAETIRLAAAAGAVGGSIEDASQDRREPVYGFAHAVDRVRAAVEAARALPFAFVVTARAENYLMGRPDLDDTIRRLQAFQEAGADVLYAPGVQNKDDLAAIVRALDRPVNAVMGLQEPALSLDELSEIGVKRVSIGSALARAAFGTVLHAAREMRDHGTFTFATGAVSYREISAIFSSRASPSGSDASAITTSS